MKEEELRRRVLELTKEYTKKEEELAKKVLDLIERTGETFQEGISFLEILEELGLNLPKGWKKLKLILVGLEAKGLIEELHSGKEVEYVEPFGSHAREKEVKSFFREYKEEQEETGDSS